MDDRKRRKSCRVRDAEKVVGPASDVLPLEHVSLKERDLLVAAAESTSSQGQSARVKSLRSHASAWLTMVCRSSKCGCHLSRERTRSEAATICAGSPARRPANVILKSTPETRFTASITSSTEKPRP